MAFFKLDIHNTINNVERHGRYSKSLKEQINLIYNSLIGADAYWKDVNTVSFISRVKKDGYSINDYIYYLDNSYNEILAFCDSVKNVCNKYCYNNIKTISYNDNNLSNCIRYLNQAIEILNINLRRLNSLTREIQYVSLSSVYAKISQISKIIKLIEELKNDLNNFCDSINGCLLDSKLRKSRIEKNELGASLVNYIWNLTDSNNEVAKVNIIDNVSVNSNAISVNKNYDFSLGYNVNNYGEVKKSNHTHNYNNDGLNINAEYYASSNESVLFDNHDNSNVILSVPNTYVVNDSNGKLNSNVIQNVDLNFKNVMTYSFSNQNENVNDK